MRYLASAAALFLATACVGADEPPKATRVIQGAKTTFPAKSIPEGVKALAGVLESCSNVLESSHGNNRYTADDLKKAQKGDHVRFVFPRPLQVRILGKNLEVSEAVYSDGAFWLLCGKDVVRYSKYRHEEMKRFEAWYRQTLPAD